MRKELEVLVVWSTLVPLEYHSKLLRRSVNYFFGLDEIGSAETVMQNLKRLGFKEADAEHPLFGDMKSGLDALAKQRYRSCSSQTHFFKAYLWGPYCSMSHF